MRRLLFIGGSAEQTTLTVVLSDEGLSAVDAGCCFGGNKNSAESSLQYICRNGSTERDRADLVLI